MIKHFLIVILFTPVLLFSQIDNETVYYGKDYFIIEGTIIPISEKESPYDRLPASYKDVVRKPGYKNLYYIETPKIIDSDNEGTVDAIHFTDLGFLRYADFLIDSLSNLELLD